MFIFHSLVRSSDRGTYKDTGVQVYELKGLTKADIDAGAEVSFGGYIRSTNVRNGSIIMKVSSSMDGKIYDAPETVSPFLTK